MTFEKKLFSPLNIYQSILLPTLIEVINRQEKKTGFSDVKKNIGYTFSITNVGRK